MSKLNEKNLKRVPSDISEEELLRLIKEGRIFIEKKDDINIDNYDRT